MIGYVFIATRCLFCVYYKSRSLWLIAGDDTSNFFAHGHVLLDLDI